MGYFHELGGSCSLGFGDNTSRRCAWCGDPLPPGRRRWCQPTHHRQFVINHYWSRARAARLREDGHRCQRCGTAGDALVPLEVNHKTPILGRHGEAGCWHHQEGLETLCHPCHVDETAQQRAAGRFRADAREPLS